MITNVYQTVTRRTTVVNNDQEHTESLPRKWRQVSLVFKNVEYIVLWVILLAMNGDSLPSFRNDRLILWRDLSSSKIEAWKHVTRAEQWSIFSSGQCRWRRCGDDCHRWVKIQDECGESESIRVMWYDLSVWDVPWQKKERMREMYARTVEREHGDEKNKCGIGKIPSQELNRREALV